jgi:thioredoxin 1
MFQWIRKNIGSLAVLGAVVVIAGMSFRAGSDCCSVAGPPKGQTDTSNQRTGETAMLTSTKPETTVYHADETTFDELVLKSQVPVLVDFYADWCGPCRMIAPLLEELARESSDAKIVKVDVDNAPQLARRYAISSIPSLKVFEDGKVVDEHVGLASKAQLKAMLGI